MFTLNRITAKLAKFTPYTEMHGDEAVSGTALKMEMVLPRSVLATLHPGLEATLFRLDDPDLGLAYPEIESIAWKRSLMGATVDISNEDLFGEKDIHLTACEVDKIVISAQNGGSVGITVRVKAKPDADDVGRIYELQQQDVLLTITPPVAGLNIEVDADPHSGRLALDGTK